MRKTLELLAFEDKNTQAGKGYVRWKTDAGWMSCFDSKSNEKMKALSGEKVEVEVIESGEFQNIKKFLEKAKIDAGAGLEEIGAEIHKSAVGEKKDGKREMYISYAKDAFCAIVTRISQSKFDEMSREEIAELMDLSIAVIKRAERAF